MSAGHWEFWDKLKEELVRDEFINRVKKDLELDANSHKGFAVFRDNLLYKGRLVVPANSPLIPDIIA